jgi:hypothetical protein
MHCSSLKCSPTDALYGDLFLDRASLREAKLEQLHERPKCFVAFFYTCAPDAPHNSSVTYPFAGGWRLRHRRRPEHKPAAPAFSLLLLHRAAGGVRVVGAEEAAATATIREEEEF